MEHVITNAQREQSRLIDVAVSELLNKYAFKDVLDAKNHGYEVIIEIYKSADEKKSAIHCLICKVLEKKLVPEVIVKTA